MAMYAVRGGKFVPLSLDSTQATQSTLFVPNGIASAASVGVPTVSVGRPTGANYVTYESLYVTGDSFRTVLGKVTGGKILTLPTGVFEFQDFNDPISFFAGIRIPPNCGGIWGSGRGTILRMTANSSTVGSNTTAVPTADFSSIQAKLIEVVNNNTLLKNFTVQGTNQGHFYNGISAYGTQANPLTGLVIDSVFFDGAAPGGKNFPPGETFSLGMNRTSGVQLLNCEFDGRHPTTRARWTSSLVGVNNSSSFYAENVYMHHASTGAGFAFYRTNGLHTLNCRAEYNGGSAVGYEYAGPQFNHEEITGVVLHENPTMIMDKTGNPQGYHMTINSSAADGYSDNPNYTVTNVTHDPGRDSAGCFSLQIGDTYAGGASPQTSLPVITKNGVTLVGKDSSNTAGASPSANFIRYH